MKGQAEVQVSVSQVLPFGENTPSSKIPHKRNSTLENRNKKGGARPGHPGHGRSAATIETPDEVVEQERPDSCTHCHVKLLDRDARERTIVDTVGMRAKEILYRCKRGICPSCLKVYSKKPKVLRKSLYGNNLIAHAAAFHHVHGVTQGKLEQMLGTEALQKTQKHTRQALFSHSTPTPRTPPASLPRKTEPHRQTEPQTGVTIACAPEIFTIPMSEVSTVPPRQTDRQSRSP